MSPNLDVANASLPAYVGSLLFFVGCLLRVKDMPGYWRWYSYLNFLRYGWGALMVNQFEGKNAIFLGGEEVSLSRMLIPLPACSSIPNCSSGLLKKIAWK